MDAVFFHTWHCEVKLLMWYCHQMTLLLREVLNCTQMQVGVVLQVAPCCVLMSTSCHIHSPDNKESGTEGDLKNEKQNE